MEDNFDLENDMDFADLENDEDILENDEDLQGENSDSNSDSSEGSKADDIPPLPTRNLENDKNFAALRREKEELERKLARSKETFERFEFKGENYDEILDQADAYFGQKPVEEIRHERLEKEENLRLKGELELLRSRERERVFQDDLSLIKKSYPTEKVESPFDLGDDFIALRAAGVDPIVAYEAIMAKEAKASKQAPPEIGKINSSESKETDYFTPSQVDKLTEKQLDDPSIMEKVMLSMTKWG